MPRSLSDQVVVITGASSGVGRETALQLAQRHTSLLLAARNREALDTLAAEVARLGGTADVVPTDVADWGQVDALAGRAVERFGRIDTWVNTAAATVYGRVADLAVEEIKRTLDVILLGQIYGMKAALSRMLPQHAGVIVNVASALAVRSVPLQAPYCAAKHGIRGFAESLRLELEHDKTGVAVVTLLPSSINTPLFDHARSKIGVKPKPVPPVYEPAVVARAILYAAEHPQAEVVIGAGGKALDVLERVAPRAADKILLGPGKVFAKQRTSQPDNGVDNLFTASTGPGRTSGEFGQRSKSTSVYTTVFEQHPARIRAVLAGAAVAVMAAVRAGARR